MIDCFHRIRSLKNSGIKIHLHAYHYGRPPCKELEELCCSVKYYPRITSLKKHFSFLPYSVISRNSEQLLEDLLKDDYPILFDGIQTTIFLADASLAGRKKAVRIHNIEPRYYRTLARFEKKPVKKTYYILESIKLLSYENILKNSDNLLTISIVDHDYYNSRFNNSILITSFHPFDMINILPGTGEYILYHGDLSINENIAVSEFLIRKVFSRLPYPCIIAGKNPPSYLIAETKKHNNISLIADPDSDRMDELIRNSQINVLPTMVANGFKLKLIISLYSGRHCIVNSTTINGSGLYSLCHIADTGEKIIHKITTLMSKPFTSGMIEERRKVLTGSYDNSTNASLLSGLFFEERQ